MFFFLRLLVPLIPFHTYQNLSTLHHLLSLNQKRKEKQQKQHQQKTKESKNKQTNKQTKKRTATIKRRE